MTQLPGVEFPGFPQEFNSLLQDPREADTNDHGDQLMCCFEIKVFIKDTFCHR